MYIFKYIKRKYQTNMFLRTQIKRMYLKGKTCVFVGKLIIQKVNCFEESKLTSKLNSVN